MAASTRASRDASPLNLRPDHRIPARGWRARRSSSSTCPSPIMTTHVRRCQAARARPSSGAPAAVRLRRPTRSCASAAAARTSTACTPSGAAPTADTRRTAAAGKRRASLPYGPDRNAHRPLERRVPGEPRAHGAARRRAAASSSRPRAQGGGPQYVERHRQQGKLPVRERIERLLDPGLAVPRALAAGRVRHVRRRRAGRRAS